MFRCTPPRDLFCGNRANAELGDFVLQTLTTSKALRRAGLCVANNSQTENATTYAPPGKSVTFGEPQYPRNTSTTKRSPRIVEASMRLRIHDPLLRSLTDS